MTATDVMPTVFEADLPTLASMSPEYQDDPHLLNREALAQGPIAMGPFGPEVLGYDAVQTVLRDRRFQMPPGLGLEMQGITSGPVWDRAVSGILSLNGADHTRLRKLVARAFTPRAAERLRAKMVEVIDELVEPATAIGACDVVADIARSYPIPVICELLGAPREDWERLSTWTEDAFKIFNFNVVNDAPDILRAFDELDAYIEAMVDERRHALRDDLLSELIRAEDHGDRLTHDELKMLAVAVLTAGTDTTRNQLAAAVEVFCAHPEQWDRLMREPALALQAVDEVMRYAPVIFGTMRVAVEDVELCDVIIPAGTLVGATTAAANRDPAVFVDPDTFDITRQESAPMLTFGGGVHYCLGVHLAKAELAEALTLMARRMPRLRQTGPAPWKPVFGISGPLSLPVVFEPGH